MTNKMYYNIHESVPLIHRDVLPDLPMFMIAGMTITGVQAGDGHNLDVLTNEVGNIRFTQTTSGWRARKSSEMSKHAKHRAVNPVPFLGKSCSSTVTYKKFCVFISALINVFGECVHDLEVHDYSRNRDVYTFNVKNLPKSECADNVIIEIKLTDESLTIKNKWNASEAFHISIIDAMTFTAKYYQDNHNPSFYGMLKAMGVGIVDEPVVDDEPELHHGHIVDDVKVITAPNEAMDTLARMIIDSFSNNPSEVYDWKGGLVKINNIVGLLTDIRNATTEHKAWLAKLDELNGKLEKLKGELNG